MLAVVTVTFIALLAFAGCTTAPAPTKAPEEVLKEGLTNLSKVTSLKYDVALNVDANDEENVNSKMNFKLNGAFDMKDEKDPKVILKLDGSVKSEELTGSAKLDFMLNKEAVYFNVGGLDMGEVMPIPEDMKAYMGKWYSYTLLEGAVDDMSEAADTDFDVEEMDELWAKTTPEYVGTDSVAGDPSWRYKLDMDEEAIAALTEQAATDVQLEGAVVTGEIWVSTTTNVVNQFKLSVNKTATAEDKASGTMSLTVTLSDINKAVTVSAPAGVTEFPVEQFMAEPSVAPLLMLMMGGGETMYDESMYDDSMLYDGGETGDFDASTFEGMEGTEMTEEELNALMEGMDLEGLDAEELEGLEMAVQ